MKKDAVVALVAVVVVLVAAYVLAVVRPDTPLTPSKPFEAAAGPASKKKIGPNDKVVMHVNGEPVTQSELELLAQNAPAESRAFLATKEGHKMLADEMVKLKALEQEGRRLGIEDDPAVRAQVNSISSQIVAGKALEKLVSENTEKRLAAEYAKEKGSAKTLRHILVAYQGSAVPARGGKPGPPVPQAMQKATTLVSRLRAGMSFDQLARTESDDEQTASKGGILGAARPDQLPPNIAQVVNTLKAGEISNPVQTEFGIHIFKVDEPSLEDLRPMLSEKIKREVAVETLDRLKKNAKVELDPTYFPPATQTQPPPAATAPKPNS